MLLSAWGIVRSTAPASALVLAGVDEQPALDGDGGEASDAPIARLGALEPQRLREVYAASDVLVVPSIQTRTFREPWGLVVNEAMNQGLAVIASDSVGAAAGGLVRDGVNGVVVPAGDPTRWRARSGGWRRTPICAGASGLRAHRTCSRSITARGRGLLASPRQRRSLRTDW